MSKKIIAFALLISILLLTKFAFSQNVEFKIENLGSIINSEYTDYGAVVNADESILMFTSRREKSTGGKYEHYLNEYYEDIYISYNKNGKWTKPKNICKPVNTKVHDAVTYLSPDGRKLLIYRAYKKDGNIYECVLKGDKWSKPRKLGDNVNTQYQESSASLSYDEKTLYFISARPENNIGGRDIYMSRWNEKQKKWGKAINLGPTINTKYDEETVFIHPDGKTLYFSSKGHNTMGGYDIFKSVFENSKWSVPENLGYPINTPDDDVSYVASANGKHAYYSSIKDDGLGKKDIYRITFIERAPKQEQLTLLKDFTGNELAVKSFVEKTENFDQVLFIDEKPIEKHIKIKDHQNFYETPDFFKKAYEYQKQYSFINDSVLNENRTKQICALKEKYISEIKKEESELFKKESEFQELYKSNNRYLIFGLIGLGTIITLLSMQQYNLLFRQIPIKLNQEELLYSQMKPHFVFNSLIAIQGYMLKKDPIQASKYLSNFANMMRSAFNNSAQEYIPLCKEIKTLENYLTLQQLRFENKFYYNIEVAPDINVETMAIPPMLAQPFIEKSIYSAVANAKENVSAIAYAKADEHGIIPKNNRPVRHSESGGRINVNFNLSAKGGKNNMILCEIHKDNNAQGTKVVISIPFKYV